MIRKYNVLISAKKRGLDSKCLSSLTLDLYTGQEGHSLVGDASNTSLEAQDDAKYIPRASSICSLVQDYQEESTGEYILIKSDIACSVKS